MKSKFYTFLEVSIALLVAALLGSLGVKAIFKADPYNAAIEPYIKSDSHVAEMVGTINTIVLSKRLIFEGSTKEPPYRKYTYKVEGNKAHALLIIRIESESPERITSIKTEQLKKTSDLDRSP